MNSKRKLSIEEVCRTYYETQIFGPNGNDDAPLDAFCLDASIQLKVRDVSFKGMDSPTFCKEITAANIELFGLAWLDHHRQFDKDVQLALIPKEIVFTKGYLLGTGRGDIWERIDAYSKALLMAKADCITWECWEGLRGGLRGFATAYRDAEDYKEFWEERLVTDLKFWVDEFRKHITDGECADRLAVRFLAMPCDIEWITALSQRISLVLAERLGRDPSSSGLFALQRMVISLYDNAVGYLDTVRDYGSYETSKDAHRALLAGLMREGNRLPQERR